MPIKTVNCIIVACANAAPSSLPADGRTICAAAVMVLMPPWGHTVRGGWWVQSLVEPSRGPALARDRATANELQWAGLLTRVHGPVRSIAVDTIGRPDLESLYMRK